MSAPNQPVCPPSVPGYRGWGVWYDCGTSLGPEPGAQPEANPGAAVGASASRLARREHCRALSSPTRHPRRLRSIRIPRNRPCRA